MRHRAHRTHLAGWLLVAATVAACGRAERVRSSGAPGAGSIRVTDDAGRTVVLPSPAQRVVSLAPSSTELLFAIGAGPQVVGRTTWCDYPPAAKLVPVVGEGLNPNVEAVTARRPDLVVLYRSALTETAAAQLGRLGIPAVILKQDRLEDIARDARVLGSLTGHVAGGDSVATPLERFLAASPPTLSHPARLVFVVWDNPPIVIAGGSFLDQLATLAGAEHTFHDIAGASATVSLETIAARDPDFIAVVSDSSGAGVPAWSRRPEWQTVRAVPLHRFIVLGGDLFGRPSPRAPEAVRRLRSFIEAGR